MLDTRVQEKGVHIGCLAQRYRSRGANRVLDRGQVGGDRVHSLTASKPRTEWNVMQILKEWRVFEVGDMVYLKMAPYGLA